MSLQWKHLTKDDAAAWSDLTKVIAKTDNHGLTMEPDVAAERLDAADFNPETDSWAVWDGDQLVAFTEVVVHEHPRFDGKAQAYVSGGVHPNWRGQGIGTEMLKRAEARAKLLLDERLPNSKHILYVDAGDAQDPNWELLNSFGFTRVRYFEDMRRDVSRPEEFEDLSAPGEDVVVRSLTPEDEEEVRLAHNDAFRSHWGAWPASESEWADEFSATTFRPDLSRVAVSPSRRVLSYALVGEWTKGRPYIMLVGARAETRGKGLGRAAISEVIRGAIADPSIESIYLDVDSENPSGAGNLYSKLGFETTRTWGAFEKDLEN